MLSEMRKESKMNLRRAIGVTVTAAAALAFSSTLVGCNTTEGAGEDLEEAGEEIEEAAEEVAD